MIYLSLDQALQTTGWAIFKDTKLLHHGKFTTPANKPIDERLGWIWGTLNDFKFKTTEDIDYVFFEGIQNQGNAETFKKLAYCQAAILLWCYWSGLKYTILPPSHWRSILKSNYDIKFGRSRTEQKKKAQELVKQIYNIDVNEDEADAICLGLAGIQEKEQNRSAF